jgi:hypothetical protein
MGKEHSPAVENCGAVFLDVSFQLAAASSAAVNRILSIKTVSVVGSTYTIREPPATGTGWKALPVGPPAVTPGAEAAMRRGPVVRATRASGKALHLPPEFSPRRDGPSTPARSDRRSSAANGSAASANTRLVLFGMFSCRGQQALTVVARFPGGAAGRGQRGTSHSWAGSRLPCRVPSQE